MDIYIDLPLGYKHCMVCNGIIKEDTKKCPHCKEILASDFDENDDPIMPEEDILTDDLVKIEKEYEEKLEELASENDKEDIERIFKSIFKYLISLFTLQYFGKFLKFQFHM